MTTLNRYAGQLTVVGGAMFAATNIIQIIVPSAPAYFGLFASIPVLGLAVLGLRGRFGDRTGRTGRWAATASALGGIGTPVLLLLIIGASAIANPTGQGDRSPLAELPFVAFLAWYLGSIIFALALIRARAVQPLASWLIVVGGLLGIGAFVMGGQNPEPLFGTPLVAYGAGWVLVGWTALRHGTAAASARPAI